MTCRLNQLRTLYPGKTTAQLWSMVGIIEMIGVDDFGPAETFTIANATTVTNWAKAQGIASLSFWALQRDNGGCPGGAAADNCSGIAQSTWQFSRIMQSFTYGGQSYKCRQSHTSLRGWEPPNVLALWLPL